MKRLRRSTRMSAWEEDIKPMDGVGNMSDAMLVFACGLMIAIAANWNVDLKVQQVEVTNEQSVTEEEFNEIVNDSDNDASYKEMGRVYMDSETGEMYMVVE